MNKLQPDEPCYIISVAARLVNMHPQTLRYYERLGLIEPSRTQGKIRLYSRQDVERVKLIHGYVNDMRVNLAGAKAILNLTERMSEMEAEISRLKAELEAHLAARGDSTKHEGQHGNGI